MVRCHVELPNAFLLKFIKEFFFCPLFRLIWLKADSAIPMHTNHCFAIFLFFLQLSFFGSHKELLSPFCFAHFLVALSLLTCPGQKHEQEDKRIQHSHHLKGLAPFSVQRRGVTHAFIHVHCAVMAVKFNIDSRKAGPCHSF